MGVVALVCVCAASWSSAQTALPLTITAAVADPSGQTVTISGGSFGSRPLVTLDLVPVTVQFAIDSQIVAAVPVNMMPPGKYLLTVSRGAGPAESASIQLTLGGQSNQTPVPGQSADATDIGALAAPAATAAKVGDRTIIVEDLDREWRRTDPAGYLAFARQLYDNRKRLVDQMVADELIAREAAARGLTVDALLEQEI